MSKVIDLDARRPAEEEKEIDHRDLPTAEIALTVAVNAILECPETFGDMTLSKKKYAKYKPQDKPVITMGGIYEIETGDGMILEIAVRVKED